ncbi:MAG TPA: methyl-accepting chemotaxis protein, partial [Solirubrobacterales bacterium]|nr:methyl-accepting chemotaxis protein [Solirubrobacterales bacterium]
VQVLPPGATGMTTPMSPAVALMKMLKASQRFQLMAVIYTVPLGGALFLLLGRSGPRDDGALVAIGLGHLLALYLVWSWYLQARAGYGELRKTIKHLSTGDLAYRSELGQHGHVWTLIYQLNAVSTSLAEIFEQVRLGARTIDHAAKEMAAGHVSLSRRTEEQASTLEETASGMEELAATVKQNADRCQVANGLSQSASSVATRGAQTVHRVVERMGLIDASARKIGDIISVIEGIAFQTNILALNAAVEAARAGEQGQGFTVVAAEVRTLAQRSAQAAAEIKGLIEESAASVTEGSKLVTDAGQIMTEIVTSVQQVTELIREIAFASREQNSGVEAINRALTQLENVTQQNAALVQQTTATTLAFEGEAQRLTAAVSRFKLPGQADRRDGETPVPAAPIAAGSPGRHRLPQRIS